MQEQTPRINTHEKSLKTQKGRLKDGKNGKHPLPEIPYKSSFFKGSERRRSKKNKGY